MSNSIQDQQESNKMYILRGRVSIRDKGDPDFDEVADDEDEAGRIGNSLENSESGNGIWYEYDRVVVHGEETLTNEKVRPDIPTHSRYETDGGDGSLYLDKDAVNGLTDRFRGILETHYKEFIHPGREAQIVGAVLEMLDEAFARELDEF